MKKIFALIIMLTPDISNAETAARPDIYEIYQDIFEQVQPCFNRQLRAASNPPSNVKVMVDVDIDANGQLVFSSFTDMPKYNSDPNYRFIADLAKLALQDTTCNPLRELPPADKFNYWHSVTMMFESR